MGELNEPQHLQFTCRDIHPLCCLDGAVDAVEGGGDYASGVSGTFTAGVQAGEVRVVEGGRVARDADRAGSAGLYTQNEGVIGVIASHSVAYGGK